MNDLIPLDLVDLGFALGLMLLTIALSAWQRLGLAWNLTLATGRTIAQLLVVGYGLEFVFAVRNPWMVIAVVVLMVGIAAAVTRNRISRKVPQLLPLAGGVVLISTVLTLTYVNLLVLRPQPWFEPQYLIPLAGVLIGNAMNAATVAGERFVSVLNTSQLDIETHLSLGATPQQATELIRRDAIKAGLMPTINSMMVVGIVTLPGMISGQILGGVNPLNAALYQLLIMFMLAFATLVTTALLIAGIQRQFFTPAAQLQRF
ncbi:MAG: iron export ABC transporter permease subunit FetB [Synechococcales cyanobacterium M58_A2018_015]|nr:iron export ABC transporter permease subunit FetB [Synechococcales cyanobacterium M58_A2018_015]